VEDESRSSEAVVVSGREERDRSIAGSRAIEASAAPSTRIPRRDVDPSVVEGQSVKPNDVVTDRAAVGAATIEASGLASKSDVQVDIESE
jgi:hypothetical protein